MPGILRTLVLVLTLLQQFTCRSFQLQPHAPVVVRATVHYVNKSLIADIPGKT